VPLGREQVKEFVLYRSTLTNKGPVYERIADFGLRIAD
jgi:2'-5' RNA ligase